MADLQQRRGGKFCFARSDANLTRENAWAVPRAVRRDSENKRNYMWHRQIVTYSRRLAAVGTQLKTAKNVVNSTADVSE
jgi:hypothetical protein